ncbi:peptidoglycan-binding protein [Pseudoroseicyclus sp. CXY001]|uniref:peptidoglycan-binding domain-containing protein n=1 Tax=Pseudoroseicyclus sp. CXY001 TaxID=3242492 RepID=UPI003571665C
MRRALLLLTLAACAPAPDSPGQGGSGAMPPAFSGAEIEIGEEGRCYGHDITPAVIETFTAQELVRPEVRAEDGTVVSPASYRTATRQDITRERQDVRFETLCPPVYTQAFVESLQRALAVRGFYAGPVNGQMDVATGRAIQDFQRGNGPDSPLLSLAAAQALGLVALSEAQLDRL